MYKTDHSAVFDGTAENFYEFAMAYGVEEAFKVKVYYIYVTLVDVALGYLIQQKSHNDTRNRLP